MVVGKLSCLAWLPSLTLEDLTEVIHDDILSWYGVATPTNTSCALLSHLDESLKEIEFIANMGKIIGNRSWPRKHRTCPN